MTALDSCNLPGELSAIAAKAIADEIALLSSRDLTELRDTWQKLYGCDAPRTMSRQVLFQAIAYRLQEQAFGGLSHATRRKLNSGVINSRKKGTKASRRTTRHLYKPGTRLFREWQGRTYEVTALEEGRFLLGGKTYRSLSAIARAITGTRWSGPAFFGLTKGSSNHG